MTDIYIYYAYVLTLNIFISQGCFVIAYCNPLLRDLEEEKQSNHHFKQRQSLKLIPVFMPSFDEF